MRHPRTGGPVCTVAGACDVAAAELREIADLVAVGRPPRNLSALCCRYARCLDAAAAELRDPACRPPRGVRP